VIVVGGEALVDLVPAGGGVFVPRLGGSPYTIAVAAGRLGASVGFLAGLSTDAFGVALAGRLRDSGVTLDLVRRDHAPTPLAVASVAVDGSASYTFYTAGTAAAGFTDPGPLPAGVEAVALGSLGMLLDPAGAAYEAVLRREATAGRLVALDPNVRPAVVADAGAYRARFRSWLPYVGLLKLSVEDALWLAGDDLTAAVRGWLDAGPRAVVLTRGEAGLSVWTATGVEVSVPPVVVTVVDTIGAGDTVQAAVLARLQALRALHLIDALDADAWRDVLGHAARAAAVTCSRHGADPPWAAEL
jgi:fructokinase